MACKRSGVQFPSAPPFWGDRSESNYEIVTLSFWRVKRLFGFAGVEAQNGVRDVDAEFIKTILHTLT